jgi:uncharacterized protein YecT (DUF1311 family)
MYSADMKVLSLILCGLAVPLFCRGQHPPEDISPAQLQTVIGLPLRQAVERRETYKAPLKTAYDRQIAMTGKDCEAESKSGQQPYNVCMGEADVQADKDFAVFYRNLQMLCGNQEELSTLQASERAWQAYADAAMKATHANWPEGSGAPGFAAQVYLSLVRNHMRELNEIYGLNIAQ